MKIFKIILIFFIINSCNSKVNYVKAKINNKIFYFELALTDQEKAKGLMFRKKLDKNKGMLFVYGQMQYLYFYMKNTLIPLDIAFIDNTNKIIDIQQMEPLDETTIKSKEKAMYALEVNRGFFKNNNLKVGDYIQFLDPIPYINE